MVFQHVTLLLVAARHLAAAASGRTMYVYLNNIKLKVNQIKKPLLILRYPCPIQYYPDVMFMQI